MPAKSTRTRRRLHVNRTSSTAPCRRPPCTPTGHEERRTRRRQDEAKEGAGRREPRRRTPRRHSATSMLTTMQATETHATLIRSRVDANHVDGEDDVSHVDAQPLRRRDLSLPPLYCSHNVMKYNNIIGCEAAFHPCCLVGPFLPCSCKFTLIY